MYIQIIQQFNDPFGVNCYISNSGEESSAFVGISSANSRVKDI